MLRALVLVGSIAAFGSAYAGPVDEFYSGKTLTIIAGMPPPDQHDNDARLLARFIGKNIPGKPTVIVQNMPGAGSLKAVQYLSDVAARDGTIIGIAQRGVMMMPLLGYKEANFDPRRLTWIGTRAGETSIVALWHTAPVAGFKDLLTRETIVAATGGGADSNTLPFMYNETIGTRFKVVKGYSGGGPMNLAMERGEVEGRVGWSVGAMRGTKEDWYQNKLVKIVLQHSLKPNPELDGVPLAQELAKTEDDRALLELFAARQEIGFPVFGPPSIPRERVEALRNAYDRVMIDPEYIAVVKKMNVDLDPKNGADMQALIEKIYSVDPKIVNRAREILIKNGAMPKG